jgi:hypothetical protein
MLPPLRSFVSNRDDPHLTYAAASALCALRAGRKAQPFGHDKRVWSAHSRRLNPKSIAVTLPAIERHSPA